MPSVTPVQGNTGSNQPQATEFNKSPWGDKENNELVNDLGNPELKGADREAAGKEFEKRVKGPKPLSPEDQAIVDKAKKEPLSEKEQDRADAMLQESMQRKSRDLNGMSPGLPK